MICTLTLNPAVDRTVEAAGVGFNRVVRAVRVSDTAAGKGVNVMRVACALGGEAEAIVALGGPLGDYFRELAPAHWRVTTVPIVGRTRLNVAIVDSELHQTLKVNEPGPAVTRRELEEVLVRLRSRLPRDGWLAVCGSLPPEVDQEVLLDVARLAHQKRLRLAVDVPGVRLKILTAMRPALYTPNRSELDAVLGRRHETMDEIAEGAQNLVTASKIGVVIVGLGHDGALMVDSTRRWELPAPRPVSRKPVGAGDALLGGFLVGQERALSVDRAFALAVAVATNSAHRGMDIDALEVDVLAEELAATMRHATRPSPATLGEESAL